MRKKDLLFPFTLIAGAIAAVAGAVVFAKNDKVQEFVKGSSHKLLTELKGGISTAKNKLDSSSANKDDKFVGFLSKTLGDISTTLEKADEKSINNTFDGLASSINTALEKFDQLKGSQIDPAVKSAVEYLKETREKISSRK